MFYVIHCVADTMHWANECHFAKIWLNRVKNGCIRVKFVAILSPLRKCKWFNPTNYPRNWAGLLVLAWVKRDIALWANECHLAKIGLIFHKNGCNRVKLVVILSPLRKCYPFFSSCNHKGDLKFKFKLGPKLTIYWMKYFGWTKIFYLNIRPSYWRLDWKIS